MIMIAIHMSAAFYFAGVDELLLLNEWEMGNGNLQTSPTTAKAAAWRWRRIQWRVRALPLIRLVQATETNKKIQQKDKKCKNATWCGLWNRLQFHYWLNHRQTNSEYDLFELLDITISAPWVSEQCVSGNLPYFCTKKGQFHTFDKVFLILIEPYSFRLILTGNLFNNYRKTRDLVETLPFFQP